MITIPTSASNGRSSVAFQEVTGICQDMEPVTLPEWEWCNVIYILEIVVGMYRVRKKSWPFHANLHTLTAVGCRAAITAGVVLTNPLPTVEVKTGPSGHI